MDTSLQLSDQSQLPKVARCDGADLKDIVRADFGAATFGLTPIEVDAGLHDAGGEFVETGCADVHFARVLLLPPSLGDESPVKILFGV
jgi:hypothetical protein